MSRWAAVGRATALVWVLLGAGLQSGCGSSGPAASSQATSASTPATRAALPPPGSGSPPGANGTLSQAKTICVGFVRTANFQLQLGVGRVPPTAGDALYAELEGLSRRMAFLSAPATTRGLLTRWADDLDRAAGAAQALGAADPAPRPGNRRFASARQRLRSELERANADAVVVGLSTCEFDVRGTSDKRRPARTRAP